jgi:hypothetical protein
LQRLEVPLACAVDLNERNSNHATKLQKNRFDWPIVLGKTALFTVSLGGNTKMSDSEDGLQIVLSAPQLAAVLGGDTLAPESNMTNRVFGGLKLVGGVLELVGAGALCVLPEPTMASKAGCFVFGAQAQIQLLQGQSKSGLERIPIR